MSVLPDGSALAAEKLPAAINDTQMKKYWTFLHFFSSEPHFGAEQTAVQGAIGYFFHKQEF